MVRGGQEQKRKILLFLIIIIYFFIRPPPRSLFLARVLVVHANGRTNNVNFKKWNERFFNIKQMRSIVAVYFFSNVLRLVIIPKGFHP